VKVISSCMPKGSARRRFPQGGRWSEGLTARRKRRRFRYR
jgi:hypothetical protein